MVLSALHIFLIPSDLRWVIMCCAATTMSARERRGRPVLLKGARGGVMPGITGLAAMARSHGCAAARRSPTMEGQETTSGEQSAADLNSDFVPWAVRDGDVGGEVSIAPPPGPYAVAE